MHPAEITNYLDDAISELAKHKLPDEPGYPSGESQYASFMIPKEEMNSIQDRKLGNENKLGSYRSNERLNGGWSDGTKGQTYGSQGDSKNGGTTGKRKESEEMPLSSNSGSVGANKLPSILSPTLPSIFACDQASILPMALSPTLPGAFQITTKSGEPHTSSPLNPSRNDTTASTERKRKRNDSTPVKEKKQLEETTPQKIKKSPPPPIHSTTPNSAKKSVSLNEYKKRKNASSNGPLTPTLQKALPSEVDSPRQVDHDKSESPSSGATKSIDRIVDAKAFAEKSQRYLTKGTSLKREADKSSRSDPILAAVTATHAILYFVSAFSCDDASRKLRGKLAQHENWKTTSEFIVWVINLMRDTKETELEGLCHQLHAICTQRLFENQQRFLRSSHKNFEDKREGKPQPLEADDQFWKIWTETHGNYFTITKSFKSGLSKLSEQSLRQKFPKTWKQREPWGSDIPPTPEGVFGSKYRLPLGIASSTAEAVGFAQSVLKELIEERGIKHSMDEL